VAASSPWFSYTAGNGVAHVVWYENAQSITLKAGLAAASGVSGISPFALGYDDADFWAAVQAGFVRQTVIPSSPFSDSGLFLPDAMTL
jgi:spore germination protein YaaH